MKRNFLALVLLSFTIISFSQSHLPIIKANDIKVDIKVGDNKREYDWNINPTFRPDPYQTNQENTKITFYTDIDSISCIVNEDKEKFDFIILLNGKDSAFTEVVYQPSKLKILRKYGNYDSTDNKPFPPFKYLDKSNENLVRLRTQYKLDSIAGQGNDVSKVINLLDWIHYYIKHDGAHEIPNNVKYNGLELITYCKTFNRGLHCGGLAIVLNECYLAMGFKSRRMICSPKDPDGDVHSIVAVYLPSLKKWVWMDPTNDAYVMNEKGELLGIEEVRDRLMNDQPLILNPEANWNRQNSISKDFYLNEYMAKTHSTQMCC